MTEGKVHLLLQGFPGSHTTKITKNLIFANATRQTRTDEEQKNDTKKLLDG